MTSIGHNGINETEAKRWMGEVSRVYDELDAQNIENMNRCRAIRERLPDIYKSAKASGMCVTALKAAVKVMRAEKALDDLIDKATPEDEDDREAFDYLRQIATKGDLFDAATRRASGDDEDADIRPNFLKESDAVRENVARLNAGIKGLPGAEATEA